MSYYFWLGIEAEKRPAAVAALLVDAGSKIAVAVKYKGQRTAVRIDNPFWPQMDADWKLAHEDA